jgi:hypothetical protein
MKREPLLFFALLVGVFCLGWYLASRCVRLELAQQTTNATVSDHESRLCQLEQDFQRRKKIRDHASTAWQWCRKTIGF